MPRDNIVPIRPLHRGVARIPEHHREEYFGVPDDRQLEVTPPPTRRDALLIFGGALAEASK